MIPEPPYSPSSGVTFNERAIMIWPSWVAPSLPPLLTSCMVTGKVPQSYCRNGGCFLGDHLDG